MRSHMSRAVSRAAPSGCTIRIVSTFAASTWRSPRFFPRQRSNASRRGNTDSITPMSCPGLRRTATRSPTAGKSFSSPSDAPLANETACSARKSRPGVATSGNPRSSRTTHPACICSGYSAAATSASKAERCAASNGNSSKAGTSRSASTAGNASTATLVSAPPLRPRAPRAKAPFFLPLPLATKTSRAAKLPSFYRETHLPVSKRLNQNPR